MCQAQGGAVKIFCTCGSTMKVFFIEHEKGTGEPLDNILFLSSFYCGHWRLSSGTSFACMWCAGNFSLSGQGEGA